MIQKILPILILFQAIFLFQTNSVFAILQISEINFNGDEFIELYSNDFLNLSNSIIVDENLDKLNELSPFKLLNQSNLSSNYNLIVGNSFIESHNQSFLDNLNCSIYVTDKSQVSNGGLKSSGENFSILINSSLNLSYENVHNWNFNEGESLNYDINNSRYYVSNFSICGENFENILDNENSNQSENTSNNLNSSKIFFDIEIDNYLTFDKQYFKFNTNATNFTLTYWIEDYLGNIVKNPRNTTSLSKKSYTPKGDTNIFYVKGILYAQNLTLNASKQFFYYSNQTYIEETKIDEEMVEKEESKISISNKNDLLNRKTTILKYDIYKGNTLKRTAYFYVNGDKISSVQLTKYSSINGQIDLANYLKNGENEILIEGFGVEEELKLKNITAIYTQSNKNKDLNSNKKLYFDNFYYNNSLILIKLISNIENEDIICYVNYGKTLISNQLNFTLEEKEYNLNFKLNQTKLIEKNFQNDDTLKLTCKYKKSTSKNYKYLNYEFNYNFEDKNLNKHELTSSFSKINFYSLSDRNISSNTSNQQKVFTKINQTSLNDINKIQEPENYISSNIETKKQSYKIYFMVLILLVCTLVIRW